VPKFGQYLLFCSAVLESIIKTYQSRLGERLLKIEAAIKNGNDSEGMQFHTEWQNNRQGGIQLNIEDGKHTLKPTVALLYTLILFASICGYS
jgi:hypothetical protein